MKLKLFFLAVVALIIASCTSNELVETEDARVLHFTASVYEPASTRSSLTDEATTIGYVWEVGDTINVSFAQNGTVVATDIAKVTTANGNRAEFSMPLPSTLTVGQDVTIYAYRSAAGSLSGSIATLPMYPHYYRTTLASQGKRLAIWSTTTVPYSGTAIPSVNLTFKHLGSTMSLKIKNTGTNAVTDLVALGLREPTMSINWLRNVGDGGATFDMAANSSAGAFVNEVLGTTLIFYSDDVNFPANTEKTFYAWFVPGPSTNATIQLGSLRSYTDVSGQTTIGKTAIAFAPGYNYVLYATIDAGTTPYTINFTNSSYQVPLLP